MAQSKASETRVGFAPDTRALAHTLERRLVGHFGGIEPAQSLQTPGTLEVHGRVLSLLGVLAQKQGQQLQCGVALPRILEMSRLDPKILCAIMGSGPL